MCDCIAQMNEKLAPRNTRLVVPILFTMRGAPIPPDTVFISTEQIERGRGKAKATLAVATYCPFCGSKYAVGQALTPDPLAVKTEVHVMVPGTPISPTGTDPRDA